MRKIDDITIRDFEVDVLMLMENAGRATAELARQMLLGTTLGKRVACLVGGGNNGGDGFVGARHFVKLGGVVEVIVWTPPDRKKDAAPSQLPLDREYGETIHST